MSAGLAEHGGLVVTSELGPVGALLFEPHGEMLGLRRVSVHPDAQSRGVARAMCAAVVPRVMPVIVPRAPASQ